MKQKHSNTGWIVGVIVVVAVIAVGLRLAQHPETVKPRAPVRVAPQTTPAPVPEQHPISRAVSGPAQPTSVPPPALGQSDAAVSASLVALVPGTKLGELLVAKAIIPRIVATINALPDRRLAPNILPLHPPTGAFMTVHDSAGKLVMDRHNSARYAAYMAIVQAAQPRDLVAWYVRYYPLFAQAYRDLGMGNDHFNDRLIFVIDQMLQTPDIQAPVELKPYKSQYAFTDAQLEALTAGQKLMIRVGPENEKLLKSRLRKIRGLLVGESSLPVTSSPR